jgi:hypothetical protein
LRAKSPVNYTVTEFALSIYFANFCFGRWGLTLAPRVFIPKITDQMKAAGKTCGRVMYDGAGHGFMRAGEDTANYPNCKSSIANRICKRPSVVEFSRSIACSSRSRPGRFQADQNNF